MRPRGWKDLGRMTARRARCGVSLAVAAHLEAARLALMLLVGVGAVCCGASLCGIAAAASPQKIRVTIPTPSVIFFPLYQAQDNGAFAKRGLDVEIVSTNGDGPDVDALISGSVQFTISTPNRLFTTYAQGKRLLAAMTLSRRMSIDCAMNKQVADRLGITPATPLETRLKSLKGLTAAGTPPGAVTDLLLESNAKRVGLVPEKDFKLIGIGGMNSMLPALENGQIDVGCTGSPFPELAVSRGKAIAFTSNGKGQDPAFDDFLFELVYVRPDYLKTDAETVRAFLSALLEAMNQTMDAPSAAALPLLKARFGGGILDDLLVASLDTAKATWKRDGVTTPTSLEKAAHFLIDTGAIQSAAGFDQLVTNDYLPVH